MLGSWDAQKVTKILKRVVTDKNEFKNIREKAQMTANKLFRMSKHKEQISSFFYKVNICNKRNNYCTYMINFKYDFKKH